MQSADFNIKKILFISIEPGEDVLTTIEKIIKEKSIKNATVLSAYGTLDHIHIHWVTSTDFPPVEYYEKKQGPYEILAIEGVIVDGIPHLHITVSNRNGAYGGHLHNGCRVLYLFEMTIAILEGHSMRREFITEKGIPRLIIK